jgi:hypothetical protein
MIYFTETGILVEVRDGKGRGLAKIKGLREKGK